MATELTRSRKIDNGQPLAPPYVAPQPDLVRRLSLELQTNYRALECVNVVYVRPPIYLCDCELQRLECCSRQIHHFLQSGVTSLSCVTCDQQLDTLEWSEFIGSCNTPDTVARDRRRKYAMK